MRALTSRDVLRFDVEISENDSSHQQELEEPKAVLNFRSKVVTATDTEHEDHEQEEESRHTGTETVNGLESGGSSTIDIDRITEPVGLKNIML